MAADLGREVIRLERGLSKVRRVLGPLQLAALVLVAASLVDAVFELSTGRLLPVYGLGLAVLLGAFCLVQWRVFWLRRALAQARTAVAQATLIAPHLDSTSSLSP